VQVRQNSKVETKHLRILNLIITLCYIFGNYIMEQNFDGDFYQDISIILFLGAVLEIYLHELKE